MRTSLLALLTVGALAGCADETSLLVEVTSPDLVVPDDVDALRFQVAGESGSMLDQTFSIQGAWPHSLTVLPKDSTSEAVTITVTALKAGTLVVERRVNAGFTPGLQRRIDVALTGSCVGVMCGAGETCSDGRCVPDLLDGGVDGGMDAGMDGGEIVDTGVRDTGVRDTGVDDTGVRDTGVPDTGLPDTGLPDSGLAPPELLFTEYIEGSGNNKALEIQNLGSMSFDLGRCQIQRYTNGATTFLSIPLTGTVAPGALHVICNTSIDVSTSCDQTTGSLNHNGDDALALHCDGDATPIDSFGRVGEDPGTEWGTSPSSLDHVLTRQCGITMGDTNPSDPFDPATEWTGRAWVSSADLAGLGTRAECP